MKIDDAAETPLLGKQISRKNQTGRQDTTKELQWVKNVEGNTVHVFFESFTLLCMTQTTVGLASAAMLC
jgi:hypothetical protein